MYTLCFKNWWRIFRVSRNRLKVTVLLLPLIWLIIWINIYIFNYKLNSLVNLTQFLRFKGSKYLVNSEKCQITNLDPFNEVALQLFLPKEYQPCTNRPLLTYITKVDNVTILNVNESAVAYYGARAVVCCYSNITRREYLEEPDDAITSTECRMFASSITLEHDTIHVKCYNRDDTDVIYQNTHATYFITKRIKKKMNRHHQKKPISVLLIGIDSMSRLNFIRSLPNTYNYVENNEWIPLKGYNKLEDTTLPNLLTVLTGRKYNVTHDSCNPSEEETFGQCPMIWDIYRNLGYITSFAEDNPRTSTFNHNRKGFSSPPADFYFRPYMMASESLLTVKKYGMPYCTGPETSGERIMNLVKDFGVTFKEQPHFGWFWMNTFSRHQLSAPSGMDDKIKELLEYLSKEEVLEHSVVIFFSATGVRFGDIRMTETGWLEDRLPFMYISLPNWFKKRFKAEYNHLKDNSLRLTSPYDLHMTLQHLLVLSGHDYELSRSTGCPSCKSLLGQIDSDRSCEDAGIEKHWCTCSIYTQVYFSEDVTKIIANYVLKHIYKVIASFEDGWMCSRYFVNNVISSSVSLSYNNDTYLLLKFATVPKAIYESTIIFHGDISDVNVSVSGVSRLDRDVPHTSCVRDEELKKYCYCLR